MSHDAQKPVTSVITKQDLLDAFASLGVTGNQIIEVHSSLSALGYVVGGARTVVDALMEIANDGGTLLMPMHSSSNTEPSGWVNPPVPCDQYQRIRENMPGYDGKNSDIRHMGSVVDNFRHRKGVVVSSHPSLSYAAWGRYAKLLCNRQSLHFPLSEESPAARLYELKGYVLMIGVDFDTCTCMHLAEYRSDCRPIVVQGASVTQEEGHTWKKYLDLDLDSDDFLKIRPIMEKKKMIRETSLQGCPIRFFQATDAVDEATKYFEKTVVYDLYR